MQRLWGEWASAEPYQAWTNAYAPPAPVPTQVVRMGDKANASYDGRIAFAMNESSPDFAALSVATQLVSRQSLWARVREKDGLSYGVSATLNVPWAGSEAFINIAASFAPANREKLVAGVREALLQARERGFGDAQIQLMKSGIASRRQEFIAQPVNAAGNLAIQMRLGRPLDFYGGLTEKIQSVDAHAVNAVLKKYLDLAELRDVLAGSFD